MSSNIEYKERAPRKRTYKKAIVRRQEMGGDRDCILRNISSTGALLEFETSHCLPTHFTMRVELDAYEVPARWIRQEGEHVGIQFTGPFTNYNSCRQQVLTCPDDPAVASAYKMNETRKQLFEMRLNQSFEETGDSSPSTSLPSPRRRNARGFGKRGLD